MSFFFPGAIDESDLRATEKMQSFRFLFKSLNKKFPTTGKRKREEDDLLHRNYGEEFFFFFRRVLYDYWKKRRAYFLFRLD